MADGTLPAGWAIDDGVGLLFEDDDEPAAFTARPDSGARRVVRSDEEPSASSTPHDSDAHDVPHSGTEPRERPLSPTLLAPDAIAIAPEESISEWREHHAALRGRAR